MRSDETGRARSERGQAVVPSGKHSEHERFGRRSSAVLKQCLLVGWLMAWLPAAVLAATPCYALNHGVIDQVEDALKRAGATSVHGRSGQDSIQRDIYDITYLLQEALNAAENSNEVLKKDYAHQALALLQRAARHGHFEPEHIEPVFTLIRQLLPDITA